METKYHETDRACTVLFTDSARFFYVASIGADRTVSSVGPGAVFGWRSLLRATPAIIAGAGSKVTDGAVKASETVVALEEGTILTIPAADFARIAGCHPDMAWNLTEELALELAAAEAAIEVNPQSFFCKL
jgi:CRP-like cAMP-binding protein